MLGVLLGQTAAGQIFGKLKALGTSTRMAGATADQVVQVAQLFDHKLGEGEAEAIASTLRRVAATPDQTVFDFITDGSLLSFIAGQPTPPAASATADEPTTHIVCPHCGRGSFI